MEKQYFILYSCCIPTKGYNRSLIADTQRGKIYFIPNALFLLLEILKNKTIEEVKEQISNIDILNEYFDFLIKNDLGFYYNSIEEFPLLDLSFESPFLLSNAIIEYSDELDLENIFCQLNSANCQAVEMRILNTIDIESLSLIMSKAASTGIRALHILIPFTKELTEGNVTSFIEEFPRIKYIYIYNSPFEKKIETRKYYAIYTSQKNILPEECGKIAAKNFSCNLDMIKESQCYNSCLNKKIAINQNGDIKNCLSMNCSFGNIKYNKIIDVINNTDFTKYWNIKKDNILVCKDCEFRYICFDCRAFIRDKNDIYSQPLKCEYNPYIAKWKGQEGYCSIENII